MRRPSIAFFCSFFVLLTAFVAATGMFQRAWSQEVRLPSPARSRTQAVRRSPGPRSRQRRQERGLTYTADNKRFRLYRIAQLPVGTYGLKVEKSGFALASHPGFCAYVESGRANRRGDESRTGD